MKIIILEDDAHQSQLLSDYLARFHTERPEFEYVLQIYEQGFQLLDAYTRDADLMFLDIHLPDMLGIDAAKRIRNVDQKVMIVFVTNLSQYAIEGYSVDAFDYILKPVGYFSFAKKLERALRVLSYRSSDLMLDLKTKEGGQRIRADSVTYINVFAHDLYIHTAAETFTQWGTLSKYEELLKDAHFVRCSAGCLVNLKYVQGIQKEQVVVAGDMITISRSRRKAFLDALAQYKGGTVE